ncbi:copper homeostasis protein CutC [Taibaiella lutea]|uniref:PF03932 family protein CutC n=1 Tax=Taibaiella lutea TaxID=2608001 RepID=A0A5M6CQ76_9BACT|nr:copper homeostasis protein CutC [Taibaiella lutea]KAA5537468.1 copper homeostasis protein CutC [Taibaiella lutea]
MPVTKYTIEIATSDYSTTQAAVAGGANRIELCANLAEGGTTASYGTIIACREDFDVLLYPIIRPRGGDFLYSDREFSIMLRDVEMCKQIGCDGIVTGILLQDGNIDLKRTAQLVAAAYPLGVTFHRAFDRCADSFNAVTQLIETGCERILTSGQQSKAMDGISLIASLNQFSDGRIVIMPGSGVNKHNIRQLAETTGCTEFHASLRAQQPSAMQYINPAFANDAESYINNFVDAHAVNALREALNTN